MKGTETSFLAMAAMASSSSVVQGLRLEKTVLKQILSVRIPP